MDAVLANVGKRLRILRRARRLTLEDLAADTGYTTGYLSQIEIGEAVPSLAALAAICASVGTDMSAFFPLDAAPGVRISRATDPHKLRVAPDSREEYVVLSAHGRTASFTAVVARYLPGGSCYSGFGERFALVLEGEVRFSVGGEPRVLRPGECIHYSSHPEQSIEVASDNPAVVLCLGLPAIL